VHERLGQLQRHHVVRNLAQVCIGRLTQGLDSAKQIPKGFFENIAVQIPLVMVISNVAVDTSRTYLPSPAHSKSDLMPLQLGANLRLQLQRLTLFVSNTSLCQVIKRSTLSKLK